MTGFSRRSSEIASGLQRGSSRSELLLDTNILSAHLGDPPASHERIQALKSSHNIEATPERPRSRNASAAEAITARIRRRTARQPTAEPIPEAEGDAPANEPAIVATPPEAPSASRRGGCRGFGAYINSVVRPGTGRREQSPPTGAPSGPATPARLPGACRTRESEVRPPTQSVLSVSYRNCLQSSSLENYFAPGGRNVGFTPDRRAFRR